MPWPARRAECDRQHSHSQRNGSQRSWSSAAFTWPQNREIKKCAFWLIKKTYLDFFLSNIDSLSIGLHKCFQISVRFLQVLCKVHHFICKVLWLFLSFVRWFVAFNFISWLWECLWLCLCLSSLALGEASYPIDWQFCYETRVWLWKIGLVENVSDMVWISLRTSSRIRLTSFLQDKFSITHTQGLFFLLFCPPGWDFISVFSFPSSCEHLTNCFNSSWWVSFTMTKKESIENWNEAIMCHRELGDQDRSCLLDCLVAHWRSGLWMKALLTE